MYIFPAFWQAIYRLSKSPKSPHRPKNNNMHAPINIVRLHSALDKSKVFPKINQNKNNLHNFAESNYYFENVFFGVSSKTLRTCICLRFHRARIPNLKEEVSLFTSIHQDTPEDCQKAI